MNEALAYDSSLEKEVLPVCILNSYLCWVKFQILIHYNLFALIWLLVSLKLFGCCLFLVFLYVFYISAHFLLKQLFHIIIGCSSLCKQFAIYIYNQLSTHHMHYVHINMYAHTYKQSHIHTQSHVHGHTYTHKKTLTLSFKLVDNIFWCKKKMR